MERHTSLIFTTNYASKNSSKGEMPLYLLQKSELPSSDVEGIIYKEVQVPLRVSCIGVIIFGVAGGVIVVLGIIMALLYKQNRIAPFFNPQSHMGSATASVGSRENTPGSAQQSATPRSQMRSRPSTGFQTRTLQLSTTMR